MSRPTIYSEAVLATIVERLSDGEPLAQICRDEGLPSYSTVYAWQQTMPHVSEAIGRARDEGEEVIAANTRNIARGLEGSSGDVQRDKLIIDTDLKLLAKWNPKKYGEKTQLTGDGGGPVVIATKEQRDAAVAAAIAADS